MRNCGESTFPKAMNATTAAAESASSRSRLAPPREARIHTTTSAIACIAVRIEARASGKEPARFCEPCVDTTVGS